MYFSDEPKFKCTSSFIKCSLIKIPINWISVIVSLSSTQTVKSRRSVLIPVTKNIESASVPNLGKDQGKSNVGYLNFSWSSLSKSTSKSLKRKLSEGSITSHHHVNANELEEQRLKLEIRKLENDALRIKMKMERQRGIHEERHRLQEALMGLINSLPTEDADVDWSSAVHHLDSGSSFIFFKKKQLPHFIFWLSWW